MEAASMRYRRPRYPELSQLPSGQAEKQPGQLCIRVGQRNVKGRSTESGASERLLAGQECPANFQALGKGSRSFVLENSPRGKSPRTFRAGTVIGAGHSRAVGDHREMSGRCWCCCAVSVRRDAKIREARGKPPDISAPGLPMTTAPAAVMAPELAALYQSI
ncbi:hypothetical protein VTK56DRAFT_6354 [Thermocarpiscus australiensis]